MIDNQIRQLAARGESKGPFLTLYVDTNKSDEAQKDRIRLFLKNETQRIREALGQKGKDDAVERGIRQIEEYMTREVEPETRGVAIFSAPEEDFFLPLQLPVPVSQELVIGSRPHLRQLVRLRDFNPRIVVAMVTAKSARLFELEFARVLREIDMEHPDLPRGRKPGGRGQYANAAHVEEHFQDHVDRHHKEVAEALTRMVEQGRASAVILSGQQRNVANFRTFLPKRVEEKIVGVLHLDLHARVDEVVESCQKLANEKKQEDLRRRLEELESVAQKNGRGVLGVSSVADAVNQRKIEHLFVSGRAESRGWRCTNCSLVGHAMSLGCPVCGASVITVDLIDEFISAAHLEDAKINFVPDGSILDGYEGVGALVRF